MNDTITGAEKPDSVARDTDFEESIVSLYNFETPSDIERAKECIAIARHRIASSQATPCGEPVAWMKPDWQKPENFACELSWEQAGELAAALSQSPAPDALGPMQRCPVCHTRFQQVHDVDAHIDNLATAEAGDLQRNSTSVESGDAPSTSVEATTGAEKPDSGLLPCPFCRGLAFLEAPALGCDWHVYCDDCGASGADCPTMELAITAWNTRITPPPPTPALALCAAALRARSKQP